MYISGIYNLIYKILILIIIIIIVYFVLELASKEVYKHLILYVVLILVWSKKNFLFLVPLMDISNYGTSKKDKESLKPKYMILLYMIYSSSKILIVKAFSSLLTHILIILSKSPSIFKMLIILNLLLLITLNSELMGLIYKYLKMEINVNY